ncbi:MAG TPA: CDC27 family protein [Fimbriimonadaceae bacterium]|jgi:tetratricopeptide (TPR) repeat protein
MAANSPGSICPGTFSEESSSFDLLALATQSQSPSETVIVCDRILVSDPGHLPALEVKSKALWRMGQFEAALKSLDKAIALNPFDPGYHFLKGDCLQGLSRNSEALDAFERCRSCASGNLAQQTELRIKALQDWQSAVAGELACSDAAFRMQLEANPVAAMAQLGFKVSSKQASVQAKPMQSPGFWARPS